MLENIHVLLIQKRMNYPLENPLSKFNADGMNDVYTHTRINLK